MAGPTLPATEAQPCPALPSSGGVVPPSHTPGQRRPYWQEVPLGSEHGSPLVGWDCGQPFEAVPPSGAHAPSVCHAPPMHVSV
jgi:hypothetical protein